MDGNQNTCKKCGTPLPTGATFCAACGTSQVAPAASAAAPQAPTAPVPAAPAAAPQATAPAAPATPAYTAPQAPATSAPSYGSTTPNYGTTGATTPSYGNTGTTTPGYGATGTTTPGYGTTGATTPGYSAPQQPYGAAGAGGYGGGTPGYGQPGYGTQPPAPPKKKGPLVPILIICGVLVVVVVAVIFFMNSQKQKEIQAEYDALVTNICSSSSTSSVAAKEGLLDTFKATYPDFVVDADVEKLMDACVEYEDAYSDDEYRYTEMLGTLEDLSMSSNSQVANCADKLASGVQADYDAYLESLLPPEPDPDEDGDGDEDGDSNTLSTVGVVTISDGEGLLDVVNSSSTKTATYFEIIIFGYNSSGERINGDDERGFDLRYTTGGLSVAPGEVASLIIPLEYCADAAFGIAHISYAEYDDGTAYGVPMDDLSLILVELYNIMADSAARQHVAGGGAADTLPAAAVSATLPCGPTFSAPEPKRVYGKVA